MFMFTMKSMEDFDTLKRRAKEAQESPGVIDEGMVELCSLLNEVPYLASVWSCSGHPEEQSLPYLVFVGHPYFSAEVAQLLTEISNKMLKGPNERALSIELTPAEMPCILENGVTMGSEFKRMEESTYRAVVLHVLNQPYKGGNMYEKGQEALECLVDIFKK